jgi:hypothetical protein
MGGRIARLDPRVPFRLRESPLDLQLAAPTGAVIEMLVLLLLDFLHGVLDHVWC